MNKKILKNYCFVLDNFKYGVNKRLYLIVSDFNLKDAKKQITRLLGKIVSDKMTLNVSKKHNI